jgi:hypothetical protein
MANDTINWFAAVDWGSEQHQACILDAAGKIRCKTACKTFQIPGVNSAQ